MAAKMKLMVVAIALTAFANCPADTFKHRQTQEIFHGFATQKQSQGRVLVFVEEENKLKALRLDDYEITPDNLGRHDNVVVIPIDKEQILLSRAVATAVAKTIVSASNNGPRCIILDIDSPGGYGEYTKLIADVADKTDNCPIVAFISSGKHGGAFASATTLAMSCDKVFISPGSLMAAVAPAVAAGTNAKNPEDIHGPFNPKELSSYADYAGVLAKKNHRSAVLAMAMLDPSIEVVEVKDLAGRSSIINLQDRKDDQRVVRYLTRASSSAGTGDGIPGETSAGNILTLTPAEAVKTKMADKILGSLQEIIRETNNADARLVFNRSHEKVIKKFDACKRRISQSLAMIERLHEGADRIQSQLDLVEEQIRSGTITRQVRRQGARNSRLNRGTSSNRQQTNHRFYDDFDDSGYQATRTGRGGRQYETVTVQQPTATPAQFYYEIGGVLNNLIRQYKSVIALAKRFPGALPAGITARMLQRDLDSTTARLNSLRRRSMVQGVF